MNDISKRLTASIKFSAINGNAMERGVVENQICEAIRYIRELESKLEIADKALSTATGKQEVNTITPEEIYALARCDIRLDRQEESAIKHIIDKAYKAGIATGNGGECSYPECECAFDMQADNKCLFGKQSINPTGMPDCRTCKFYGTKSGECTSVGKCSNKYMMYQPLNKVVLYATGNGGDINPPEPKT